MNHARVAESSETVDTVFEPARVTVGAPPSAARPAIVRRNRVVEALARMTREQSRDTGMALVLILLLLAMFFEPAGYLTAAMVVHLVNMIAPQVYRPAAVVWLGFSHVLGNVMSRVILFLVFLIVVTPVGLFRRLIGADAMRLKEFKASNRSVMQPRNHTFTRKDIEHPY